MANAEVRKTLKESGVFYWQVADAYGLSDTNFSKLLRKELSKEKKNRILKIIEDLATKNRKEE